jgi:hypothetical protein
MPTTRAIVYMGRAIFFKPGVRRTLESGNLTLCSAAVLTYKKNGQIFASGMAHHGNEERAQFRAHLIKEVSKLDLPAGGKWSVESIQTAPDTLKELGTEGGNGMHTDDELVADLSTVFKIATEDMPQSTVAPRIDVLSTNCVATFDESGVPTMEKGMFQRVSDAVGCTIM